MVTGKSSVYGDGQYRGHFWTEIQEQESPNVIFQSRAFFGAEVDGFISILSGSSIYSDFFLRYSNL